MNDRYSSIRPAALRTQVTTTIIDSAAHRVLRNTYLLLALTLGFSAIAAGASAALRLPHPGVLMTLVGFYGLLFLVHKFQDRAVGIGFTFALTGFMGYTLGPILSVYLNMPHGTQILMTALGGTAAVFLGMSAYALTTKRDLSFMGSFLFIGMIVAIIASLAAIFLHLPALSLAVSAAVVLLMSGMILFETNNIVRGGETNYVLATVSLFVSIFNLFISLLQLLGFASRD